MNKGNAESFDRLIDKLKIDLGAEILEGLKDPKVQEIQLNSDGSLFFNQSGGSIFKTVLPEQQGYAIILSVAGLNHKVITEKSSAFNGYLPKNDFFSGERFTAEIPPTTSGPSFTLRKKPLHIWTLKNYIEMGLLTENQAIQLRELVSERKNIIVCGGPNSGKTTFTNALIAEVVAQTPDQRIIILEDTPELQCTAKNREFLFTSENITMTRLLRQTMRKSPERILVGEVTGGEALDLLKAWNTGCPGGLATIHANGPFEAIQRLQDLAMEAGLTMPPISLVKHTVNAAVFVTLKNGKKGFIQDISIFGEQHHETLFKVA